MGRVLNACKHAMKIIKSKLETTMQALVYAMSFGFVPGEERQVQYYRDG